MNKTSRQVNQEKWFAKIEEFLSSVQTQNNYCQEQGINKNRFLYWLQKYRAFDKKDSSGGFIALQPSTESTMGFGDSPVTLRRGAVELSFDQLPDLERLVPLIKALA